MKKIIFIIFTYFLLTIPVYAKENGIVNIYIFHSHTCSHCKEEIKLLELIEEKYENVNVYKYEISDSNNKEVINKVEELYGLKIESVPLTIIGDKYYRGYSSEKTPSKLMATIKYYSIYGYQDRLGATLKNIELPKKEIQENQIGIDEYIKENSNYNIIFNIESDEIDINTVSSLLGIKTSLNIINIFLLIGIVILIATIKNTKEKIIVYGIFGISVFVFEILNFIIEQNLKSLIIFIIILIFTTTILLYLKKYKNIIKYILTIGITGLVLMIQNIIRIDGLNTLKKIFEINLTTPLGSILNIIIYIFSYIFINVIIILLMNKLIVKLKNKLVVQKIT